MKRSAAEQIRRDMRLMLWTLAILVAAIFLAACVSAARSEVIAHRFSPGGGAQSLIIEYTDKAKQEIYWQAYNFTSQPLADALKRAHARGVHVVVILDYTASRQKSSKAAQLAKAGITVYLDAKHQIAHDKTRIFDGKVVLTGSYNDSASAENRNGESLFAFNDKDDVEACIANFKKHLLHSTYLDTQVVETDRVKPAK